MSTTKWCQCYDLKWHAFPDEPEEGLAAETTAAAVGVAAIYRSACGEQHTPEPPESLGGFYECEPHHVPDPYCDECMRLTVAGAA
jgi:hypothetical protein